MYVDGKFDFPGNIIILAIYYLFEFGTKGSHNAVHRVIRKVTRQDNHFSTWSV